MVPISYFIILSTILFVLGAFGFFVKRDLITQFLCIEVMLSAANLAFIAFAKSASSLDGQIFVIFIITVAAAEAAVGLAIILLVYKHKKSIKSEDMNLLKG